MGRGGRVVERRTFGRGDRGSKPPVAERRTFRSKGPGFKTTCGRFKTWANLFTPLCSCLSEETLKAVGPFYLVSMPGEVKDPTQGVTCCGLKEWWSLSLTHQFPNHQHNDVGRLMEEEMLLLNPFLV